MEKGNKGREIITGSVKERGKRGGIINFEKIGETRIGLKIARTDKNNRTDGNERGAFISTSKFAANMTFKGLLI